MYQKILRTIAGRSSRNIIISDKRVHDFCFNQDFPVIVNYTRFTDEYHLSPNFHNYFEIAYLWDGAANFTIRNEEYQLNQGDLVIIGNNLIHTFDVADKGYADFLWIAFMPEAIFRPGDPEMNFEYVRPFYEQEHNFLIPEKALEVEVAGLIIEMFNLAEDKNRHYRIRMKTCMYQLLTSIMLYYDNFKTAGQVDYNKRQTELNRLQDVFNYTYLNYNQRIHLDHVAGIACMSKNYFCKYFKNATGYTYLEFLTKVRIDRSKELLLQGKKSVTEIAYDVGFDNLSHFYRTFKRLASQNPGEYQQRRNIVLSENGTRLGQPADT